MWKMLAMVSCLLVGSSPAPVPTLDLLSTQAHVSALSPVPALPPALSPVPVLSPAPALSPVPDPIGSTPHYLTVSYDLCDDLVMAINAKQDDLNTVMEQYQIYVDEANFCNSVFTTWTPEMIASDPEYYWTVMFRGHDLATIWIPETWATILVLSAELGELQDLYDENC